MKAFLLAAGKGTRLKPYTDKIPKCLIPIHGKPLLHIWVDLLACYGIHEVLINTHYLAEKVDRFIERIRPMAGIRITTVYERRLLGSAGTVLANRNFVDDEEDFMIIYADNLTNINLNHMIAFHRQCRLEGGILTMGLFHAPDPQACGIAVLDDHNKIVEFTEKPQKPTSDMANSGIYVASKKLFDFFPMLRHDQKNAVSDLGFHIFPNLVGKMYGYEIKEYLRDIGTIDSYQAALSEWLSIKNEH
jgi:mannose-1-phosphate guanylyltransferase